VTALRAIAAVFSRSEDADYVAERRDFTRQRLTVIFGYVTLIYPAFGLLDWVVYPQHVTNFLAFRAAGLALGLPLFLSSRLLSDRIAYVGGFALVLYETASIAMMCAMTGGFSSPYVVGVILCFLATTTIEAFEPLALAIVFVALTVVYATINARVEFRTSEATASMCFLVGAVFFCLVCAALLEAQRRRLFAVNSELRKRNGELELAKQQQGKFLSTISHELRSPVNSILGFVELIDEREAELRPRSRENLAHVRQSGQHLLSLINDLLDLAKAEAGRMEVDVCRFDLTPVVHDVAELTRALVRTRPVTVQVRAPEHCEVESDPVRLRQILLNLTSNAAKFTPEGVIEILVYKDHTTLVIEVTDTGVGIPDEAQKLIFEAFRQVHQGLGVGGTGLGLSIVSHLMDLLGGHIEVESTVGRGSTFRLAFGAVSRQVAA
jgi:signal transduction histidine kinase